MGQLTLTNFREELDKNLGSLGLAALDPGRLDRWINFAYFEIIGAVEFPELEEVHSFNTVAGTDAYALPANTLGVTAVFDLTSKKRITKTGRSALLTFEAKGGRPRHYARIGANIVFRPVPNKVFNINVLLTKEPALLTGSDKTVLPTTWDYAVVLLATAGGFLSRGQANESQIWLSRAIGYMQTRALYEERDFDAASLSVGLAKFEEDVVNLA